MTSVDRTKTLSRPPSSYLAGLAQSIGLSHGLAIVILLPVDQSRPRREPVVELPRAATLRLRVVEPLVGATADAVAGAERL
jgi:hypothetical protein